MPDKPLLILDLDETLIHATAEKIRADFDFQVYQYFVYKRPGLTEFLTQCAVHFTLAVWSSASDDYVQAVVKQLFPGSLTPAFVWGRSRCTRFTVAEVEEEGFYSLDYSRKYEFAKRLKKVARRGYDLKRTLIVDDTPEKVSQNYGNAIYIKPYLGELTDNELPALADYLLLLKNAENVRNLEKRHWRQSP
ncbi:HAD family hydrolase [Hymenobacter sp. H14-R3]|uniref:NIF family HAD-type phosphatase n=1 Tax=Hymenobacter sp. H14-R3 TaxID=3046308 RepID=UPI0024B88FCB|nr:HAD family hydrolase [Hymenobacter sp. H14-R3]MDJ0365388.1 HAD family hydrolase [Hymenobacter sp. H14-R3]